MKALKMRLMMPITRVYSDEIMRVKHASAVLAISLSFVAQSAAAAPADTRLTDRRDTVALIADTADRICERAAQGGSTHSSNRSGSLGVELKGLIRRLAEAGVHIDLMQKSEVHSGVLADQVLDAAREANKCKTHVFDVLTRELLPGGKDESSGNRQTSRVTETTTTPAARNLPLGSNQITHGNNSPAVGIMTGGSINVNGR